MKKNTEVSNELLKMQRIAGIISESEYKNKLVIKEDNGSMEYDMFGKGASDYAPGDPSQDEEDFFDKVYDMIQTRLGRDLDWKEAKKIETDLSTAFAKEESVEETADEMLYKHFGMDYPEGM